MKALVRSVVAVALASTASVAAAANNDPGAGTWQLIVLSSPTQFSVPPPLSTTSPQYQSELGAIRSAQAQISDDQKKAIDYWKGGGVLGWNRLLLEFVARADLPPAPRADGTYPAPDANNPFADPMFPFAILPTPHAPTAT